MRVATTSTLLVLGVLLLGCASIQKGVASSYLGKTLDGRRIEIEEFRGRPVVLAFWASWCRPCRKELPRLELAQKTFGMENLVVVAVNQGESKKEIRRLLEFWGEELEMFITLDSVGTVGRSYRVTGIPTTVVVNRDGMIQWRTVGYEDGYVEELAEQIARALTAPEGSN